MWYVHVNLAQRQIQENVRSSRKLSFPYIYPITSQGTSRCTCEQYVGGCSMSSCWVWGCWLACSGTACVWVCECVSVWGCGIGSCVIGGCDIAVLHAVVCEVGDCILGRNGNDIAKSSSLIKTYLASPPQNKKLLSNSKTHPTGQCSPPSPYHAIDLFSVPRYRTEVSTITQSVNL